MQKILFAFLLASLLLSFGSFSAKAQEVEETKYFNTPKFLPGYGFKKRRNTDVFQGNTKKKKYFEGWYFKMVAADGENILSVIPGISFSEDGKNNHAFIQVIDGKTAQTYYYNFAIEDFQFSKKEFDIKIGNNYFSKERIILDLKNDSASFKGEVTMVNQTELTNGKNKKIGIMGWYRFVPFLQCYHGVVSLTHNLQGQIKSAEKEYNFNNGLGYIEKDWGKSMPSAWIWIQSNNFASEKTSFMLSLANVPWLGNSFNGFLGFFTTNGITERFGTYSGAKLNLEITQTDTVKISIVNKPYTYEVSISRSNAGILKAPVNGSMDRRIAESIDAKLHLKVLDKNGNIIFNETTNIAGFEMVGEVEKLGEAE